jgi:transcriptional regulator with XRE-family HTH domain
MQNNPLNQEICKSNYQANNQAHLQATRDNHECEQHEQHEQKETLAEVWTEKSLDLKMNADFRKFLADELVRRSENSPRYSLRAFARHLDVDSSFLSKILNGKRTVTLRTIHMFGEKLNLPTQDLQRFEDVSHGKKMKRKLDRLLEKMPSEEREQSTILITVDESRLSEAKDRIKNFRKELAEFLHIGSRNQGKTYQISVSMFPISGFTSHE